MNMFGSPSICLTSESKARGNTGLVRASRYLLEQPLPSALVLPEAFLQIFENPLEVRVGSQIVPRGIFLEPRVVFIAQVNGAAQPMQRLTGIAIDCEVGRQT